MGKTKKIQIKAEYLSTQIGKRRKRKEKPKMKNYMTPNKVQRALIDRIKEHQKKQEIEGDDKKEKPVFATDFKSTLNYLDTLKNKTIKKDIVKKEKKRRRRRRRKVETITERPIETKITNQDDPPYGILKGGNKPLYSQYKKTLRKNKTTSFVIPDKDDTVTSTPIINRQEKLQRLRKKIKTPTRKIRKKRYTLGKRKRKVGILIKSRGTRKKIKREHERLKKKKLSAIKLYLKKHGLIKVGSSAPEKVLRGIYEMAVLSGDIYNKNSDVLLHNYINDEKMKP